MLLVILFAFTYFVIQKRKDRQSKILTNVKQNPLLLSKDLDSASNNPWDQGTMIRSNIWFDTLQKSLKSSQQQPFVNPMLTSFHSIVEDLEVEEDSKSKSATDKTSLASDSTLDELEEPNYENYPRSKRDAAILTVQRSKSMLITSKQQQPRRKSLVSNLDGDIHMRQPSIRFQSTAGRKSDKGNNGLRRSNTFAFQGTQKTLT